MMNDRKPQARPARTSPVRTSPARINPARPSPARPARGRSGWLGNPANHYAAIRWALMLVIVVYTALVIHSTATRDVPFSDIERAMSGAPALNGLMRLDANVLQERFGVNADELDGWLLYGGDTVMEVSELLAAKVGDPAAMARLEAAVRAHLDGQIEGFRNYGTNQIDLLEHAILWQRGDYLFYAVSESVEQLEARFDACIT